MPFDELETFHKDNKMPEAKVSYEHATEKSRKAGAKPRLYLSIPTTVCGMSKSVHHRLLLGTGDDTGKLRVVGGERGVKPSEHSNFFRWNFGHVPRLGETTFEAQHVPVVRVDDETFEVTVPASWFDSGEVE